MYIYNYDRRLFILSSIFVIMFNLKKSLSMGEMYHAVFCFFSFIHPRFIIYRSIIYPIFLSKRGMPLATLPIFQMETLHILRFHLFLSSQDPPHLKNNQSPFLSYCFRKKEVPHELLLHNNCYFLF